jgi:hypothetical protein
MKEAALCPLVGAATNLDETHQVPTQVQMPTETISLNAHRSVAEGSSGNAEALDPRCVVPAVTGLEERTGPILCARICTGDNVTHPAQHNVNAARQDIPTRKGYQPVQCRVERSPNQCQNTTPTARNTDSRHNLPVQREHREPRNNHQNIARGKRPGDRHANDARPCHMVELVVAPWRSNNGM